MKFIATLCLVALFLGSANADVKSAPGPVCAGSPVGALLIAGPVTSYSVLPILEYLTKNKSPVLVINSPGGEMDASIMIADAIKAKGGVRCFVSGLAASGAFAILQACSFRAMSKDSLLGSHEPSMAVNTPFDRFESRAITERLEASTKAWNDRCRARLKVSQAEYEARVKQSKWNMDASEALRVGAVDIVTP